MLQYWEEALSSKVRLPPAGSQEHTLGLWPELWAPSVLLSDSQFSQDWEALETR